MRSNRPSYASTPAGSAKALRKKAKPRRPKREWNQIMLMVFFILLPFLGLLAIFFQPFRWLFILCTLAAIVCMWLVNAFLKPGRSVLSIAYGLLLVLTFVTALRANPGQTSAQGFPRFSMTPEPSSQTTPDFSAVYGGGNLATPQPDPADLATPEAVFSDTGEYIPSVKSGAEIALENFMERWRRGIYADMVEYTAPSWRAAQQDSSLRDAANQQLFWKFASKPLIDWRQMSAPTGTDSSNARTITVQADVTYSGETRTYEYEAIALQENGNWYIDPDSLSSGILKEAATPTPDPNVTPTPTPGPTPTPTPSSKMKLYYNKDGGKRYHADPECYTVDKKYLPMASFTYGELGKHPALEPCKACGAPDRP